MKKWAISVVTYGFMEIEAESFENALEIAINTRKDEFEYPETYPDDEELVIEEIEEF